MLISVKRTHDDKFLSIIIQKQTKTNTPCSAIAHPKKKKKHQPIMIEKMLARLLSDFTVRSPSWSSNNPRICNGFHYRPSAFSTGQSLCSNDQVNSSETEIKSCTWIFFVNSKKLHKLSNEKIFSEQWEREK